MKKSQTEAINKMISEFMPKSNVDSSEKDELIVHLEATIAALEEELRGLKRNLEIDETFFEIAQDLILIAESKGRELRAYIKVFCKNK